jgi:dephospho-CoA kinase
MKVLITGWSGSGKSTVCQELVAQGYVAVDGDDVAGLSEWVRKDTGQKVGRSQPKDYSHETYNWDWDEEVLRRTLSRPGLLFLCGNANNALRFYDLFDKVFMLDVAETEQRRRMMVRTEHDYGKDLSVQNMVIEQQREFVNIAQAHGAVVVDAMPSPQRIIASILGSIRD